MDSFDLPWLPCAETDFSEQVRSLRGADTLDTRQFRRLATARLSLQQLTSLARALPKDTKAWPSDRQRLRVLSNGTVDLMLPALAATAPRHGIWLEVSTSAFGTYVQEALDPHSQTNRSRPDIVLLALDHRAFDLQACAGNTELAQLRVDAALSSLAAIVGALQQANHCVVIVQTLAPPPGSLFGSMDARLPGTPLWLIEEFNRRLRAERSSAAVLLDVAALAASVGLQRWHDPSLWSLGKFPFSQLATPLYAESVCRLVMAVRGLAKKCLVLDLDNTVWGGVIGDDGLEGIVLGQGSPTGEAHLAVQAAALALRERGIVLAVSSKNDERTARLPFREHPEMLLREQHIAVFQANWQDKVSNLRAIANALNFGIDALVLLDDNPAERHQVRMALPEVGVPELPSSPEFYAPTLLEAGYFEAVQFTPEDRERAAQYQANAARIALLGDASDLQAHLASLAMQAFTAPFDAVGRARITQLINKTNQFNLTARRRTEAEVAALEHDDRVQTLQVRLKDRFGDNGMICVVVCVPEDDAWFIDTWLMSCRVLNRGVEQAVLNVLVELAAQRGVAKLRGRYIATERNDLVRDLYRELGFGQETETTCESSWLLEVAGYRPHKTHISMQSV